MKRLSRLGAVLAWSKIVALYGVACDVHIDCAETQTCAEPHAGDAGTLDAAPAPEAGDPGPLTCAAGTGNCDGARFNGCEVDLTRDVNHCGGCDAACDGACRDARCSPLQVIATNQRQYAPWGAIGFDAHRVYWGSSPDADPNLMTWRIQSAPKAGGTVAQGPPSYSVDRLYVGNGVLYTQSRRSPAVFRLSLDGSQAYPIIANAKAYDYDAGKLVWTEDFGGGIDIWKLDEASLAKTALSAAFANEPHASISFHDDLVAYADRRFIAHYRSGAGAATILEHAGLLGRLRVDRSDTRGRIVWSDFAGLSAIEVNVPVRTFSPLVYGLAIFDFALNARGDIYYAWEKRGYGVRGISLLRKNDDVPSLVAAVCGRSLEVDGDYLYFFDCEKHRLVRLSLEAQ